MAKRYHVRKGFLNFPYLEYAIVYAIRIMKVKKCFWKQINKS